MAAIGIAPEEAMGKPWVRRAHQVWKARVPPPHFHPTLVDHNRPVLPIRVYIRSLTAPIAAHQVQPDGCEPPRNADPARDASKSTPPDQAIPHGHPAQYLTHSRHRPCAGIVVPARRRSLLSMMAWMSAGFSRPRPTSTSVPAMIRTML